MDIVSLPTSYPKKGEIYLNFFISGIINVKENSAIVHT
jgi:hypothetical protein